MSPIVPSSNVPPIFTETSETSPSRQESNFEWDQQFSIFVIVSCIGLGLIMAEVGRKVSFRLDSLISNGMMFQANLHWCSRQKQEIRKLKQSKFY